MGKEKRRISDLKWESEARLGNHGLYSSLPFTVHIFKGLQINRKGNFSTLGRKSIISLLWSAETLYYIIDQYWYHKPILLCLLSSSLSTVTLPWPLYLLLYTHYYSHNYGVLKSDRPLWTVLDIHLIRLLTRCPEQINLILPFANPLQVKLDLTLCAIRLFCSQFKSAVSHFLPH